MKECMVSIICVTYNQREYLAKALDSFLSQKTEVAFEIIVHDDASTDGTTEILRDYQNKYPHTIHALYEEENIFSKGIDFFTDIVKNVAKGKYIAICEGDDYWISEGKLQRQYVTLEAHPECDMCACGAQMVSTDEKHILGEVRPKEADGILTMEESILGGGMYLATASLFFRKSMYDHIMRFEKVRSLDYVYQMKGALRGGIYYIDQCMAAYRRYSKGSQTESLVGTENVMSAQCVQEQEILRILDEETGGRYHEVITKRLQNYQESFYDQLESNRDAIFKHLNDVSGNIYVWGMGLRGQALERFLTENQINIQGICDITDKDLNSSTQYGNRIVACEDVLVQADAILASVNGAYEYLKNSSFKGILINMQDYMSHA